MKIQAFLDECTYRPEYSNLGALSVLAQRKAHCLDGALFAAAALRRLGYPPVLVNLLPEPGSDDDHLLAIFRVGGYYGAVAKSNFVGLRFREPVFRTLRELVLSYFENFFNVDGKKTLREYTAPFHLKPLDRYDWECEDSGADMVEQRLQSARRFLLVSTEMAARLNHVDDTSYKAGMLVVNPAGLYKPTV